MSLKKVVDQNILRDHFNSEKLISFLRSGNFAILHDYTSFESTKGNAKINLRRSIEILKQYPKQVLILKAIRDIIRITNHSTIIPKDLIDIETTRNVKNIFRIIDTNDELLAKNTQIANDWFKKCEHDAVLEINNLRSYKEKFTVNELQMYREWRTSNKIFKEKIVTLAISEGWQILNSHGYAKENFTLHANCLVFRYSLAIQLLRLDWIQKAKFDNRHVNQILTDLIDAMYYTIGTYFNGCLTADKLSKKILEKLKDVLKICYKSENFLGNEQ